MDLEIHKLREALIQLLNDTEVPASVVYYIVKDLLFEIEQIKNKKVVEQKNAQQTHQVEFEVKENDGSVTDDDNSDDGD